MDDESQGEGEGGLLATVARVLGTLRNVVENRVELFLLEAKEDRLKLFEAVCLAIVTVGFALLAMILVTFTIIVIFWDSYRLTALMLMTLLYGTAAVVAFIKLRSRLKNWQSFPATLEQLEKDRACFKGRS